MVMCEPTCTEFKGGTINHWVCRYWFFPHPDTGNPKAGEPLCRLGRKCPSQGQRVAQRADNDNDGEPD